MNALHSLHLKTTRHILKYFKSMQDYKIFYQVGDLNTLFDFTNMDWVGDSNEHKSTSSYMFKLRLRPIIWCSPKQSNVAFSSIEVEHRGIIGGTKEATWL
jgi:hypothetical protein